MVTQTSVIRPFGYTGEARSNGVQGLSSVNLDTHRRQNWPSRGFKIERVIANKQGFPGGSWIHEDGTGVNRLFYYLDDSLYRDDGTATPVLMTSALTNVDTPVFVNMGAPAGQGVFFDGTNGNAQLIRNIGGVLKADLLDFSAPSGATAVGGSGGSLTLLGTYYVAVVYADKSATSNNGPAVQTTPQVITVTLSGAENRIVVTPSFPGSRETDWKVYVSSTTNSPSVMLLEEDNLIAVTSVNIDSLTGTETIPFRDGGVENGGEFYQQATMPLADINSAWVFQNRLCIASSTSNKVYISERGNFNHWYSINEINSGSGKGWSGSVIGGIAALRSFYVLTSNSVHVVWGTLIRDSNGIWDVDTASINDNIGLVGPNAITTVNSKPTFISNRGLEIIQGTAVQPIKFPGQDSFARDLSRTQLRRTVLADDPLGYVCILAPRLANASRPMDGASFDGIPDRIFRFDYINNVWAPPLSMGDITHIISRPDVVGGDAQGRHRLFATSFAGVSLKMHEGWSGGGAADVSGIEYDGKLVTDHTTTSAKVSDAITSSIPVGATLEIFYPKDDPIYPGVRAIKTITGGTIAAGTVTWDWLGALPVPTGSTKWTVRLAGYGNVSDVSLDVAAALGVPPGTQIQIHSIRVRYKDTVGDESIG